MSLAESQTNGEAGMVNPIPEEKHMNGVQNDTTNGSANESNHVSSMYLSLNITSNNHRFWFKRKYVLLYIY